ncbi:MAG: peptidoglycan DD-metalloendopeptidase family protein [Anaerolineae bacterium]
MIESQTELPVRECESATSWAKSRHFVALVVDQVKSKTRTLSGTRGAYYLRELRVLVRALAQSPQIRSYWGSFLRWVAAGKENLQLNRFALHLVVVLLAVGVVTISQLSLPQIDFLSATPTPAPDLGKHTVSKPPTSRGVNRLVVNTNQALLFQAPVPHTIVAERDRMEIITYTVQPNDNVWAIAQAFGLKVETIVWANPAVENAPDLLSVGQVLVILPVDGVYYTVQTGDTVEKIAKKFKTTPEKIVSFKLNGLQEPYTLTPGQKLVLPDGQKPAPRPAMNLYPMTRVGSPPKGAPKGSGRFAWPTQGYLSQQFWSGHLGIDIANRTGVPVYAADDGYVLMAGRDTWGYGNQVVIDHGNGYLTRYAHLNTILVKAGQFVKKNQKIGTMGSTGRSTGPHLHFEVIYNGTPRNPLGFLP